MSAAVKKKNKPIRRRQRHQAAKRMCRNLPRGLSLRTRIFRMAFGRPDGANAFVRDQLPAEQTELLSDALPTTVPGIFVDRVLDTDNEECDLLLRFQMKTGKDFYVYLLLLYERGDPGELELMLVRYIDRIATYLAKRDPEYDSAEMNVFPIVILTGRGAPPEN